MALMPDPGFRSTTTDDRERLHRIEAAIARHAEARMAALQKFELLRPASGTAPAVGVFPHGRVDVARPEFTATDKNALQLSKQMAPDYPAPLVKESGDVTFVETSEELILTAQDKPGTDARRYRVPNTHLVVCGDIVTLHGRIALPGKHVVIFARELRTLADGTQKAELNTDGEDLADRSFAIEHAPDGQPGAPSQQRRRWWVWAEWGQCKWEVMSDQDPPDLPGGKGGSGDDVAANPPWSVAGHPEINGRDGVIGKAGTAGGDIFIVCDRVAPYADLTLSARGGAGGGGTAGLHGGRGGPGGQGLDFRWTSDRRDRWPGKDSGAYAAGWGGPGGNGGHGGIGGPGGRGGDSGHCTLLVNQPLAAETKIAVVATPGAAGPRGPAGAGGPPGADGANGTIHDRHVRMTQAESHAPDGLFDKWWRNWASDLEPRAGIGGEARLSALEAAGHLPAELTTPPAQYGRVALIHDCRDGFRAPAAPGRAAAPLTGVTSVTQIGMLLEAARLAYLKWDALRFAEQDGADEARQALLARLDFVSLGIDLLPGIVSKEEQPLVDGLRATRDRLQLNIAAQRDAYGNPANAVPLGSPDLYSSGFEEALKELKLREKDCADYTLANADADTRGKRRRSALDKADKDVAKHDARSKLLFTAVETLAKTELPKADQAIDAARAALQGRLATLREWMGKRFGLTPDEFIECLFNLSFIQGPFSAFTTLTSQAAGMVNKATGRIPDDEGQLVSRKHLLKRVDIFSGELKSLNEAWEVMKAARPGDPVQIRLNDPDGYRLLVAQKNLDEALARFYTDDQARAASAAMTAYVEAVQARNALVADYNNLVVDYLGAAGEHEQLKTQRDAVKILDAPDAAPDLAAEAALAVALHDRARERCLEHCYLACRAYRFWTLKADTVMFDLLELGSPARVDSSLLSSALGALYLKRTHEIQGDLKENTQPFPPKGDDGRSTGRCVVLTQQKDPIFFDQLKRTKTARFSIPHPTATTTKAESPFVSDTNVRLTRVRAWLLGIRTKDGNARCTCATPAASNWR